MTTLCMFWGWHGSKSVKGFTSASQGNLMILAILKPYSPGPWLGEHLWGRGWGCFCLRKPSASQANWSSPQTLPMDSLTALSGLGKSLFGENSHPQRS